MELFRSESYYIFVRNESSLWWNRITGAFSVRTAWDLSDIEDIECLGITEGIIGKVEHTNIYEPRLIIIKESAPVGQIYFHHTIYKIKSICFLNMGATNQEVKQTVKKQRDPKLAERFEKRLTDELHKIFDDSDSFYYSRTLDLQTACNDNTKLRRFLKQRKVMGSQSQISQDGGNMLMIASSGTGPACRDAVLRLIQE